MNLIVLVHRASTRVLGPAATFMSVVGAAWIFAIMVIINLDVFGRFLISQPIDGVPETVSLSIVGIVFLQLANTLRKDRFIRSDMLMGRLRRGRPRFAYALDAVFNLLGAVMFVLISVYLAPKFLLAYERGTYVGNFGRFTMVIWPILLTILVGTVLTFAQYITFALRDVLGAFDRLHFLSDDDVHGDPAA
ncbi:TRAP transporter small permease subunit [Aquibium oceanicum]|uniref:TRAP transporter small permease protein n=1 Tax=Aquibium oceanicum TaxID=1670800 RepID=A0A1L3SQM7_9HYPH|nr:TRAP transporter small permease subunit [Aquibium oceanicum]APH71645.1 hypothetical protein BSQ44_09910 [Aquibium oceanicum]